jgi:hypothetical protein
MRELKPEPSSLSTDLLPTHDLLAEDLWTIVHGLSKWEAQPLLALRSLPSIRFSVVDGHFAVVGDGNVETKQGVPSNHIIPLRIDDAVGRIAEDKKRRALRALLAFTNPGTSVKERQEAAANKLGVKYETFRKGERSLLLELASEMFRGELAWAIYQFQPASSREPWSINSWCQLLEFERSVVIDPKDVRRQTWTTRILLRCVKHDLPFYVTSQRWSGSGGDDSSKEPGKITVLSKSQDGRSPAVLCAIRPESDSQAAYNFYLWDLGGAPRVVGEEIEHEWQQELVDKDGSFMPYIGFETEVYPQLRKLRLRVKLSADVSAKVYAKRLTVRSGATANSYTTRVTEPLGTPIEVTTPDADGYFTYEPDELTSGPLYELWWE